MARTIAAQTHKAARQCLIMMSSLVLYFEDAMSRWSRRKSVPMARDKSDLMTERSGTELCSSLEVEFPDGARM
ncbi:hypothetical protein CVM73_23235 [Bradyrhizobium forestalis]|uniref:Uncharacterized protein n=1 Tax=Bradyrhizobium forestalis TaxID=1419263 RepID=A0A2M8R5C6_9BRAD|nr:hypothetical protein CVM73_23235 [Bradyrhizobium forestalis]